MNTMRSSVIILCLIMMGFMLLQYTYDTSYELFNITNVEYIKQLQGEYISSEVLFIGFILLTFAIPI